MDLGTYIWRNGEFIPSQECKINVVNHAMHYGSGVFEGIRCYEAPKGTAVFKLREHMERLHYSAETLELDMAYSVDDWCQATLELLKKNELKAGYIRPVAMYGEGKMGLNPHGADLDFFVAAWPWGKYLSDDPITTGISPVIRIHPKSLNPKAKINGHYVNSIMASLWAHRNDFQEAILLDYEGNVAEGPGENLFIVKDGTLYTPQEGSILPGITRRTIIDLAKAELGVETIEKVLTTEDLLSADELFLTGTAAEVTIVKSVDGQQIGTQDNKVSGKLKQIYHDAVTGQIEKYHDWLSFV